MRELTKKEKEFCKKLVETYRYDHPIRIKDIIREAFDNKVDFESNSNGFPFSATIKAPEKNRDTYIENVLELIAFITILIKQDYIILRDIIPDRSEMELGMALLVGDERHSVVVSLPDVVSFNNWEILSSFYCVTNGFRDFVKHNFKTIEQRRHRCTVIISWVAIGISILIGVFSIIISRCSTETAINQAQIEEAKETIIENKVITPETINTLTTDTLNVWVINHEIKK